MAPFRLALARRHGDVLREDGVSGATELITMAGHSGTHIDALAHISKDGKLHGGVDALEAARSGRFSSHGVDTIAPMIGRGVLFDFPRLQGVDCLQAAQPITADDLDRAERTLGVAVAEGDAILIRTGWQKAKYATPSAYVGWDTGVPGPDESAARWLSARRVRMTGTDTLAYEWLARGAGHARLPVHRHMLVDCAIPLIEHMFLDALAEAGASTFVFALMPLRLTGATASPVRPLALVEHL